MGIRISSWLSRPWSLRSLLLQARLAFRLFREPRVPMVLKAVPLLALLYVKTAHHVAASFPAPGMENDGITSFHIGTSHGHTSLA